MISNQISIIICYYNAGDKLVPTIKHIKGLDLSLTSEVELILVDNNSNDNSNEILSSELKDFTGFQWKIVSESEPGLAHARLKGFKEAKYDLVLFCDDDNWLDYNYLTNAIKVFEENHNIAVLGGKGSVVSDVDIPSWFDQNEAYYAVGSQNKTQGKVLGERNVVYGAGMVVRKSYFEYIQKNGFSFYNLGRTGGKFTSGEDSEMCLAFQVAKFDIWYDESLVFQHFVDPKRLSLSYLNKLKLGIGGSRYVTRFYLDFLQGYVPNVGRNFWIKELGYSMVTLFKSMILMDKKQLVNAYELCAFLLSKKTDYNKAVQHIIYFCQKVQGRK